MLLIFRNYKKLFTHLLFWFGFFMVFVFFWSARLDILEAIIRSAIVTALEAGVAYFNLLVLVPKYFMRRRYWSFSGLAIVVVIINVIALQFASPLPTRDNMTSSTAGWFQKENSNGVNSEPKRPRLRIKRGGRPQADRHHIMRHLVRQARNMFNALLTMGVLLMSTAIGVSQIAFKKEKEVAQYKSEKLQAEMKFLKSQINPHFLFNALNSAYTLAYIQSAEAPQVILRISDMLRYLIYECEAEKVPIGKEVTYIKNYIALQKARLEEPERVKVNWQIENEQLLVAPMLFIPFIENSFKHSHIESTQFGSIEIAFNVSESDVYFTVINSLPQERITKDKVGGIGLENVKRRLEMLYHKKYQLDITQTESHFNVSLKLELV